MVGWDGWDNEIGGEWIDDCALRCDQALVESMGGFSTLMLMW